MYAEKQCCFGCPYFRVQINGKPVYMSYEKATFKHRQHYL